jgi:hypothetical protein
VNTISQIIYNGVGYIPQSDQLNWTNAGRLPGTPAVADIVFNVDSYTGSDNTKVQSALAAAKAAAGTAINKIPKHVNDAKNSVSLTSLFLDLGIGNAPCLFNSKGTSAGIFIYYMKKNNILSFRTLGNMEYFIRAGPEPVESYSDLSILWGHKLISNKYNSIVPLIGAGKVTSIKRGKLLDENSVDAKHEKLKEHTIGISLGIKFQVNTKHTGYSLYLFSNINSIRSYYGALFCFGLGKFY